MTTAVLACLLNVSWKLDREFFWTTESLLYGCACDWFMVMMFLAEECWEEEDSDEPPAPIGR